MVLIEHGKVQGGQIVFSKPLPLPEGIEVVVSVQPVETTPQPTPSEMDADFTSLSFFGMWADREEMSDSAEWVRKEREKRRHRAARRD